MDGVTAFPKHHHGKSAFALYVAWVSDASFRWGFRFVVGKFATR